jgi:hypothetical protein
MATIDVEEVLAKLTDKEKIDLLSGNCICDVLSTKALTAVQVLTSGIRKLSQNMEFLHYDYQMGRTAYAVPASLTASLRRAFHAARASARPGTQTSFIK